MKILALRGENLASLAGAFELDLEAEPLASAGLFAITGPTGAGKSTLLDALCLALYAELPRLGSADERAVIDAERDGLRGRDPRSALSHGAGAGYAEVDFLGQDRRRYRARWSVRRARERADGRLQADSMQLSDLETGDALTEKKQETLAAIRKRVGLSFDQFRRSALLAQGEFDAFIRADARERALLLERVTGTEIYARLSLAAHDRNRAESGALMALREEIARHAPLDRDARASARAERDDADRRLAAIGAEKAAVEAALAWRAERERRRAAVAGRKAEAETAESAFAQALARAVSGVSARLTGLREERDALAARLEERKPEIALAARVDDANRALEQRETARRAMAEQKADGEKAQARLAETDALIGAESEALTERRGALEKDRAKLVEARAAHEALDESGLETALGRLSAVAERLGDAAAALESGRRAKEALAETEKAAVAATTAKQEAETQAQALNEQRAGTQAALEAEQRAFELWSSAASDAAKRLRAQLAEGEPCPVCGSREHHAETLDKAARQELDRRRAARDAAQAACAEIDRKSAASAERATLQTRLIAEAEAAGARETKALETARGRWREARRALSDLGAALTGASARATAALSEPGAEPEAALARLREAVAEDRAPLAERLEQARAARRALDAQTRALEKATTEIGAAETALNERRGARERLAEEARAIAQRLASAGQAEASAAQDLDRLLGGVWPDWRETDTAALRKDLAALAETVRRDEARFLSLEAALPRLAHEQTLVEELRADAPATLPEAGAPEGSEPEALRRAAQTARDALLRARERAAQAAADLAEFEAAPAPDGAEDASEARLADIQPKIQAAEAERETIRHRLAADDATRLAKAKALRALRARGRDAEIWAKLDELIGSADGAKFRRFAQSLTLANLVALANARLAELHPRYRLSAPASESGALSLEVIDRDMGDAVRAAHSLSGGERFLVSLALALGLASLSSERGAQVSSLFIDEGFGALDGDSLSLAVSALESLQATGRQIGVISHVEELKERIAVKVEVAPLGGGRSRLQVTSA